MDFRAALPPFALGPRCAELGQGPSGQTAPDWSWGHEVVRSGWWESVLPQTRVGAQCCTDPLGAPRPQAVGVGVGPQLLRMMAPMLTFNVLKMFHLFVYFLVISEGRTNLVSVTASQSEGEAGGLLKSSMGMCLLVRRGALGSKGHRGPDSPRAGTVRPARGGTAPRRQLQLPGPSRTPPGNTRSSALRPSRSGHITCARWTSGIQNKHLKALCHRY